MKGRAAAPGELVQAGTERGKPSKPAGRQAMATIEAVKSAKGKGRPEGRPCLHLGLNYPSPQPRGEHPDFLLSHPVSASGGK